MTRAQRRVLSKLVNAGGAVVKGEELHPSPGALQVHIFHLRKELPEGARIENVLRHGYRLSFADEAAERDVVHMVTLSEGA